MSPYVKLAESKGKLALAWRRRDDDELASVGPINEDLLNELRGLDAIGVGPGYSQFAPPMFGPESPAYAEGPTDFPGSGRKSDPEPEPEPTTDLDSLLDESEVGSPADASADLAAVVPDEPDKPTWKMQIYVGNDAINQEFELPEELVSEEVISEEEMQELQDTVQGEGLWNLLKQAL